MNRIFLRLMTLGLLMVFCLVLLALSIGQLRLDEEEIVYSASLDNSDSEIYRMVLNRQLVIPLTRNSSEDTQPAWSSDGQQIAFVSNSQGQFTIYVMNALGRNIHRLTSSTQNNFSPTWSPDNRAIAYVTARQEFAQQISEVLLTDLQSGLTRRMSVPYPNAISPAWSPDSRHLTFTSAARASTNRIIYNLDLQTGDTFPLIAARDVQLSNPTWSPDGHYLLYLSYDSKPGMYLWDTTANQSTLLFAPDVLNMRNINWSPDSRYIIYAPLSNTSSNSILRLDVTTCLDQKICTPQALTHVVGIYDSPRWRPRS